MERKCPFCGSVTATLLSDSAEFLHFNCPVCTLSMSCKDENLIEKLLEANANSNSIIRAENVGRLEAHPDTLKVVSLISQLFNHLPLRTIEDMLTHAGKNITDDATDIVLSGTALLDLAKKFVERYLLLKPIQTDVKGMTFNEALAVWKEETSAYSSPTQIREHTAYKDIVNYPEKEAVPGLLEALASEPWIGFMLALHEVTGAVLDLTEDDAGKVSKVAEAWLEWGHEEGYYDKNHYEELSQK